MGPSMPLFLALDERWISSVPRQHNETSGRLARSKGAATGPSAAAMRRWPIPGSPATGAWVKMQKACSLRRSCVPLFSALYINNASSSWISVLSSGWGEEYTQTRLLARCRTALADVVHLATYHGRFTCKTVVALCSMSVRSTPKVGIIPVCSGQTVASAHKVLGAW